MEKKIVRKEILKLRNNLSQNEIDRKSDIIQNNLIEYIDKNNIRTLFAYMSYGSEVQTDIIIDYCVSNGVKIALPVITDADESIMEFYQISGNQRLLDNESFITFLKNGYMNILEPDTNKCKMADFAPQLLIMPGVAFDEECNRIGYGKGFYDRYISNNIKSDTELIALAFEEQIVKKIDSFEYDIRPDKIFSELRIIKRNNNDK